MKACICRLAMVGLLSLLCLFSIASTALGQDDASPPNATAQAEPDPTPPPAPLLTFDQITELRKRLDDSADLDPDAKTKIKSKLDDATIQLQAFEDQQTKANGYQLTIDTAEERFKEATTLSQQPLADPKEGVPPVSSFGSDLDKALADIDQRLVKLSGELIEAEALETSDLVGKPLREVNLPSGVILGAIVRDGEMICPTGSTIVQSKDRVVLFAAEDSIRKVEKMFSVQLEYF